MSARYVRYRTPVENGERLSIPPAARLGELLSANLLQRSTRDVEISGRSLQALARDARQSVLELSQSYTRSYADAEVPADPDVPLIVSGHQPDLTHPGVWLKSFDAARLAKQCGGVGINLIIDSDACRGPSIRVPTGTAASPRVETVALDRHIEEMPYEERRIVDSATWQSFPARVEQAIAPLGIHPWIQAWWPEVLARSGAVENLGLALAQAQHRAQIAWQSHTLELPLSRVCRTPAFRFFAVHLLENLVSFQAAYNDSLHEFRQIHRVRNSAQPMPDLGEADDWLETPFWIWFADDPRRRALFAKRTADGWRLADLDGFEQLIPQDPAKGVEFLTEWESCGIKLRPRALITTMFARLVLADLFIHGIGGARYDQVTDAICERFFGFAPPAYATISGTLRLPIGVGSNHSVGTREIRQLKRELIYHPESHLEVSGLDSDEQCRAGLLVEQKKKWVATPKTPANAVHRHRQIASANQSLQTWLTEKYSTLERSLAEAERHTRANSILQSREYVSCLFPRELLQEFLLDFPEGKSRI